ncbi:MAG: hypothetical protein WCI02_14295 [Planctomycetota bacterium]
MREPQDDSSDPMEFVNPNRIAELESQLRSASDFVRPTDSLRGQILVRAKEWNADRTRDRAIFRTSTAAALCLICAMFTMSRLEVWWINHPAVISSARMQERADRLAKEHHLQSSESIADAFQQWRENLASKWWAVKP